MGVRSWLVMTVPLAMGCGGEPVSSPGAHPLADCAATATAPESVAQTVEALSAIPEPTIPCLVASLERPLRVVASRSQFSAQPAVDDADPRLFLLREGLVLTVVTAGFGQTLLELGQWETPRRTLKAELEFPLTTPVPPSAPFEQVLNHSPTVSGVATGCAVCHAEEEATVTVDGVNGYTSDAYRPLDELVLPLARVEEERDGCADEDRSDRCLLLRAVIDFGAEEGAFDPEVATF